MKTKPSPGDLRPRTPHDPEGFDPVDYRWDGGNCKTCPFWGGFEDESKDPRENCPRIPASAVAGPVSDWDRLACLARNRPDRNGTVKYVRRAVYGNEED